MQANSSPLHLNHYLSSHDDSAKRTRNPTTHKKQAESAQSFQRSHPGHAQKFLQP